MAGEFSNDVALPRIPYRPRFSLRTLLFVIVYAALACAWTYWLPVSMRDVVGSGILGGVSVGLIAGSLFARQSAIEVLILGCFVVLLNVVSGYVESHSYCSTGPLTPQYFARIVVENVCARTLGRSTLPLLALIPATYVVFRRWDRSIFKGTRWFLIAIAIAVVDVAIVCAGCVGAYSWFART